MLRCAAAHRRGDGRGAGPDRAAAACSSSREVGFFTVGDTFGDPVCVSPCRRGTGTSIADVLCDGDENGAAGVCNARMPGTEGVCLPICDFDSTKLSAKCQGKNQCASQYFATTQAGEVISLGVCVGACTADSDCKGSPGAKCQIEEGLCVNPDKYVAFVKAPGNACTGAASECNCHTVGGAGASKDRGYCTSTCITGAAGDSDCGAANTGWRCTAGLPTKFTDGKSAFTGQPDGIVGSCAKPCAVDADCTALAGTIGGGVAVKCEDTAGFKICAATP
jgi:hypothetical protein